MTSIVIFNKTSMIHPTYLRKSLKTYCLKNLNTFTSCGTSPIDRVISKFVVVVNESV